MFTYQNVNESKHDLTHNGNPSAHQNKINPV